MKASEGRRWLRRGGLGLAVLALLAVLLPSSRYLLVQGYFQAVLLLDRQPIDDYLAQPGIPEAHRTGLAHVKQITRFGEQVLKFSGARSYRQLSPHWQQEIWNVSACQALAFEPYTWWFPIVGTIPYKGFFRKEDALKEAARLRQEGWETAVRRVAGYSTLGWFDDPLLPEMLSRDEADLANLVLHELAHGTLFIPGQVDFNESLASFVGDAASLKYLAHHYGADSAEVKQQEAAYRDRDRFQQFMHDLYLKLDLLYRSAASSEEKRARRSDMLAEAEELLRSLPLETDLYRSRSLRHLNNADLLAYRRYSRDNAAFQALLDASGQDFPAFFARLAALGTEEDPFEALRSGVESRKK